MSALPSLLDGSSPRPTLPLAPLFTPTAGAASLRLVLPRFQAGSHALRLPFPASPAPLPLSPGSLVLKDLLPEGPPPLCFKEPEPGQPLASPPE